MSTEDKTSKPKRMLESTLATLAVEGLRPSKESIDLCNKRADGKLTCKQAVEIIKEKYANSSSD